MYLHIMDGPNQDSIFTAMLTSGCTRGNLGLRINIWRRGQLKLRLDGHACTFLDLVHRTWQKRGINSRCSRMTGESYLFLSSAFTLSTVSAVNPEFCPLLKSNALLLLVLGPATAKKRMLSDQLN
jgi:hypothetical protein